jgi:hypothetical protein
MLSVLLSSQTMERALLFLFVNNTCYAHQIQTQLKIPLTPVQKALLRLEKGGVLHSTYQGKTRVYTFNPSYPLKTELEALLKKTYTLLPSAEKKRYCFIHKPRLSAREEQKRDKDARAELIAFWEKLQTVKTLWFTAKSHLGENRSIKTGKAQVVISEQKGSCIFQEKGFWFLDQIPDTAFSNTLRWTLDPHANLLTLEHLRYGPENPVFLFHLTPTKPGVLESVDAHLCADDTYLGSIVWDKQGIEFCWRIIGPKKNEDLTMRYL